MKTSFFIIGLGLVAALLLAGCSGVQQPTSIVSPSPESTETEVETEVQPLTDTPTATITQSPTNTSTPTTVPTETAVPSVDGVLPIPPLESLSLADGDIVVTIVSTATNIADVENSLVLGVIAQALGSSPVGFGRCDIVNHAAPDDLSFMQALMSGGYSCLVVTTSQGERQPVASVGVEVQGSGLARSAEELAGSYDGPDSTKIVNPGQAWGYYFVFEVPSDATEVEIRLEFHEW